MSIRYRPPRWLAGCLAFLLLFALLAGPAEARTGSARAVDRIRAALQSHASAPIARAVAAPHSTVTRPVYPLEGPAPNPARKPAGRPALLSLADQRDAKGLRRVTLDLVSGSPGTAV